MAFTGRVSLMNFFHPLRILLLCPCLIILVSQRPFSRFPPLFSGASVREGSNSWLRSAAPSAVRWRTSQGQRERLRSVDGCVLCSITALTDTGKEGSRREWRRQAGAGVGGIKWFNLGRALKSLRESKKKKKAVEVLPVARVEVSLNEWKRLVGGYADSGAACSSPPDLFSRQQQPCSDFPPGPSVILYPDQ